MENSDIVAAVKRGLEIIKNEQNKDGGFSTLSSTSADFSEARAYRTTFAAANILGCLNSIRQKAQDIWSQSPDWAIVAGRTVEFLLVQKSDNWSWNYWSRTAPERETMPYPDDLDDTFAALAALHGHDPNLMDGGVLACVVKLLTAAEVEPGGPYRTWSVASSAPAAWQDIDIVVNSNIGNFLSRFDVKLPGLERFIEQNIQERNLISQYYPSVCHVTYFVSRHYRGAGKAKILEALFDVRRGDGSWATPLESAMAISAIVDLGFADSILETDIASLIDCVEKEDWLPHPFCVDPSREGQKHYAGSRALTAAFIIEALVKWMASREPDINVGRKSERKHEVWKHGVPILEKIKRMAHGACGCLPASLKGEALACINEVKDPEIVLVPYRVRDALRKSDQRIERYFMRHLALANLFGWMAYGIYDNLLDGEGVSRLLPVANFFLRQVVLLYHELGHFISGFDGWWESHINSVDEANLWEVAHCRLPVRDGVLSLTQKFPEGLLRRSGDKSMAHVLPAIAVSLWIDDEDTKSIQALISFFRHYLIARQLHDDAHDWVEDLAAGRLTAIGARLLEEWRAANPGVVEINVPNILPDLRRRFWRGHIEAVVGDIMCHTGKARRALQRSEHITDPEPLTSMLDQLDQTAACTLREREEIIRFLEIYQN
jgi:hypothetical protein